MLHWCYVFSLWLRQRDIDWDTKASKQTQLETETTNNAGFHVIFITIWVSSLSLFCTALKHRSMSVLPVSLWWHLKASLPHACQSLCDFRVARLEGDDGRVEEFNCFGVMRSKTLSTVCDLTRDWSMLHFTQCDPHRKPCQQFIWICTEYARIFWSEWFFFPLPILLPL